MKMEFHSNASETQVIILLQLEVGNDAKLIRLFINNMKIASFNGYTKMMLVSIKVKGKVFYGQEPSSGESTTTESGVNYQLLSVMH